MSINWADIILDSKSPQPAWAAILSTMLDTARQTSSPVVLHDLTVVPDRLLTEAAWELWEAYPEQAPKTSEVLKEWTRSTNRAVLILDALSLRELHVLLSAAESRGIIPNQISVTGAECPSTTDQFAKAIGIPSRSALANDKKPGTFSLFDGNCYTDVFSMPFEDCAVPPTPNLVIWHSWLDDLIHKPTPPDQIAKLTSSTLQGDGFWQFVSRLRQGRNLVITSDHGYAVSKRFSSQVEDPDAIKILRETFGASRNKAIAEPWEKKFMPPIVMSHNKQHIVMGQKKWNVQGGFPEVCHGGMSILEVAVPFVEFKPL